jgi:sugar lactone lactonase YvrE
VAPDGTTSTLAGNGDAGFEDGTPPSVMFTNPYGIGIDSQGTLCVADSFGMRIREVAPDGTTSTLSGNGDAGWSDGTGGPDGMATFYLPIGVTADSHNYVYVGDYLNNRIRKIAPDGTTSTLAGNGDAGSTNGPGGPAGTATFAQPTGVAVDAQGNVYVSDTFNNLIRKVAPDGTTTTLAGDGDAGFLDGPGSSAQFQFPFGLAVDAQGNVYVADTSNNRIRKVIQ